MARRSAAEHTGRMVHFAWRALALAALASTVALPFGPASLLPRPTGAFERPDPQPEGEPWPEWTLRCDSTGALRSGLLFARSEGAVCFGLTASPPPGTPAPLGRPAFPAALADRFVAAHAASFGVSAENLAAGNARRAGRLLFFEYAQTHRGLPVLDARLNLACDADGTPRFFESTLAGGIELERTRPLVEESQARERALDALVSTLPEFAGGREPDGPASLQWRAGSLAVLPAREAGGRACLVWTLACRVERPAGLWRFVVDAISGEVLEISPSRVDLALSDARVAGTVTGIVRVPDPLAPQTEAAFPHLSLTAFADGVLFASGHTDSAGRFDFGDAPAHDSLSFRATLAGRFASMHVGGLDSAPASLVVPSPDGLVWSDLAASPAERECYLAVSRAHDRLREHAGAIARDDPDPFAGLDVPLPVVVADEQGGVCEAYAIADPEAPELHFSPPGASCLDPARMAGIVFHEYAHLATLFAYGGELPARNLSEAFSDFEAASQADTPFVALNWTGPGEWVRALEHGVALPLCPECEHDSYCASLPLSGALWRLRSNLEAAIARDPRAAAFASTTASPREGAHAAAVRLAETLFQAMRLGRPRSFEACLWNLLLQDDDDGDLQNGTPHFDAIANAFERHGIGDFSPLLAFDPLPDRLDPARPDSVHLEVSGLCPAEAAWVHARIEGGSFVRQSLTRTNRDRAARFSGVLPAVQPGERIEYFFTARDALGHEASLPAAAPSECLSLRAGPDTLAPLLQHASIDLVTAGQEGIWLLARASDNRKSLPSVLADAALVRGGSVVREATWTLMPKAEGSIWRQTRLSLGPFLPGDRVRYRLRAVDAAPANNPAFLPAEGAFFEARVVDGRAWDFEEAPLELSLAGWEARAIGGDDPFFPAPSGNHALVARAAEAGVEGDSATLLTSPLDLRGWERARLDWARAGGPECPTQVYAREAGQSGWRLLDRHDAVPLEAEMAADGGASWQRRAVSLDAFAGTVVEIRFATPLATAFDEAIDDLRIAAAPALAPPQQVRVTNATAHAVTLQWLAPHGEEAPLGYRLYRAQAPGAAEISLTREPVSQTEWIDETCVEGLEYYYSVAAEYPAGESPRAPGTLGIAALPRLSLPLPVDRVLPDSGTAEDTLLFVNEGTGSLALEFAAAEASESWGDQSIAISLTGHSGWGFLEVAEDGEDAPDPDIRSCEYRIVSHRLVFRLGFHRPLPDPRTAFTICFLLDTDRSRATGSPGAAVGADRMIVLGKAINEATQGLALGYLLDGAGKYLAALNTLSVHPGLDSLEVACPLAWLDDAGVGDFTEGDSLDCEIVVAPEASGALTEGGSPRGEQGFAPGGAAGDLGDRCPDAAAPWLRLSDATGIARPGSPFPLVVTYPADPPDFGSAQILVRSSDPEHPLGQVSIRVRRVPGGPADGLFLAAPVPNPFSEMSRLSFRLPGSGPWRLDVVDVTGRLLRRLAWGDASGAKTIEWVWNGLRDDGTRVESGCYYAVLQQGKRTASRSLLLIR